MKSADSGEGGGGGDSDLRLRNDQREPNGKLQTTSKGVKICYLVFDERYNAH